MIPFPSQGRKMVRASIVGDHEAADQKISFEAVEHKIPEELINELDSFGDESENDSDDEADPTPEFEDVSERSNSSGAGILKTSPLREAAPKQKAQRTNVAMEAILRQQRQQTEDVDDGRKQVAFKTPTPEPPSLPQNSIQPQWLPRPPMPPRPMMPSLPPTVMTGVPGNPDPVGQRNRFGSAEHAPFLPIRPLSSSAIQQPRRPQMDFTRVQNYHQNIQQPRPNPWMGQQQAVPLRVPANLPQRFSQPPPNFGGPLNLDARSTWPTPAPAAAAAMASPRLPAYNPSTGPTYSLFSGPSWQQQQQQQQQQQHQHQPQHQNHNMFQSGPSALERLLRQQRNEKQ